MVAADAMMSGGDGQPETLAGVTVTLDGEHVMGETMETGMDGGFAFTGLRAGTYTVTISDFPEDVSFETVSVEVEVDVGEVGQADFTGHYIRTSAVEGQVIIDGEGLAGVTVTLNGGPADESHTMMTNADGMYRFEDLRPGDYTVSISDFDTRDYEFAATSQDVSVDLDETGTVSFTGVLLRTSGISGRVSADGEGLKDIAVTLSGAADASTMTDESGQYSFAGLAAGDYTVTIAVESDAYVFDVTSVDVTVGDDQSKIVSFDGQHARTASISGQFFFDELDKNNMMDAGERTLASAGIQVALVGPGVNDVNSTVTNAEGRFMFPSLRAGTYQLVVLPETEAELAKHYLAYGGPATGYTVSLGVGEAKTQAVPLDITHTTVNFTVSLKSGDEPGDALPGAMVTLYGTGNANVGSDMTDDNGSVSITVARDRTSGHMVNAGVSHDDYDVADGMTAVSWDPQMFATSGSNDNDIVNLNVNVTVSGTTVDRGDYGGGKALAGWALMGDGPDKLGDDGTATFETTVDAVPASFSFMVAEDQDDDLDGGEKYDATGGTYTHDGLSLAGNMDADPIVVTYKTQTLKVYVHEELDQVFGYTGNAGFEDERAHDLVDLEVRYVAGSDHGRTRAFDQGEWDADEYTDGEDGEYIFRHLPAKENVLVRAKARDGYQILDLARLDAYRDMKGNGVMGGAFGEMGGFHHTVTLCPLHEQEPTGQYHDECGSFAVVGLHNVSGLVWKRSVSESGTTFSIKDPTFVSGIEVTLDPVENANLAGIERHFTTTKSDDKTTADVNETHQFDFGDIPAGVYDADAVAPDGWRVRIPAADDDLGDDSPKGATGMLGDALSPLAGDVMLDITPSTTTVYGFVRNALGVGLEDINVSANGVETTTDELGRYIAEGVVGNDDDEIKVTTSVEGFPNTSAKAVAFVANMPTQVNVTRGGANSTVAITGTVTEAGTGTPIKGVTITVDGKAPLNATGGKVTTGDDGTYTAMVQTAPNNDPLVDVKPSMSGYHFIPATRQASAISGGSQNIDFTGYPATEIVGLVTGAGGGMPRAEVTVRAYDAATGGKELDEVVTTETGTFSLHVPTLSGTVYLRAVPQDEYDPSHPNYISLRDSERYDWYDPPTNRPNGQIPVIPGQVLNFGTFSGHSVQPRIASIRRGSVKTAVENTAATTPIVPAAADRGFDLVQGEPTDSIIVTWHYETRNVDINGGGTTFAYSATNTADTDVRLRTRHRTSSTKFADAAAPSSGVATPVSAIRGTRTRTLPDGTADRGGAGAGTTVKHDRITTYRIPAGDDDLDYRDLMVDIAHTVLDKDGTSRTATAADAPVSAAKDLAGVPHGASGVTVKHVQGGGTGANPQTNNISASWSGDGSPRLQHRVALYVQVGTENKWEWVVGSTLTSTLISRKDNPDTDYGEDWGKWDMGNFDLNLPANASATWTDDDTGAGYTVSQANLKKASQLRVDTKVDGGTAWKKGTPANIPPPS